MTLIDGINVKDLKKEVCMGLLEYAANEAFRNLNKNQFSRWYSKKKDPMRLFFV